MTATVGAADTDLAGEWAAWHAEREDVLRAPHGWLSLTGLHWLVAEPRLVPGPAGHLARP